MSRGPGRIQQVILSLIESDEDGAWTVGEICGRVYRGINRIEKKHRVAVSRALRKMVIPESWAVIRLERQGSEYLLYNRLSLESTVRMRWNNSAIFFQYPYRRFKEGWSHQVEKAHAAVEEYRKYHESDEVGRIDILLATARKQFGFASGLGAPSDIIRSIAEKITQLNERRADAEAVRLSVSASTSLQSGNTYQGSTSA
jgi:hypothetical protein